MSFWNLEIKCFFQIGCLYTGNNYFLYLFCICLAMAPFFEESYLLHESNDRAMGRHRFSYFKS